MATLGKYIEGSEWAGWIPTLFEPRKFLTLTSEEEVFRDTLMRRYGELLRLTNKALFGNHWHRHGEGISYAVGLEPQLRGVLHLHAIWDQKWVPYRDILGWWKHLSGRAVIEPVTAATGVAYYVTKYSVKGGVVDVYLSRQKRALLGPGGPL